MKPGLPRTARKWPFILVATILTIAMLGAVEVFAKEEEHPEAEAPGETAPEPPPPPAPTTGTTTTPEQPAKSAAARKAVAHERGLRGVPHLRCGGSIRQRRP